MKRKKTNERTKSGSGFFPQHWHTHTHTNVQTGTGARSKWVWMWNGKEQRKRLYRTPKVQNGFQLFHALCIHVAAPKFIVVYPQPHISDAKALLALINKDWKEKKTKKEEEEEEEVVMCALTFLLNVCCGAYFFPLANENINACGGDSSPKMNCQTHFSLAYG